MLLSWSVFWNNTRLNSVVLISYSLPSWLHKVVYLQSILVCMMQKARVDDGSVSFGLSISKGYWLYKKLIFIKKNLKYVTVYLLDRLGWRDSNGSKGALSSLQNKCNTYFIYSYELLFFFFFRSGKREGIIKEKDFFKANFVN